ncbi:DENN domain-containing protein 3-like [Ruditapes philippinarum]|uniref:DENN domain-containing protein 3-like n=1 Tax=Ruditapes philippinarum TaxID=129788 RepID=UPI00295AE1EF|nr:DENN domain-containing protein 3-like [Ruditapes philippinarum]
MAFYLFICHFYILFFGFANSWRYYFRSVYTASLDGTIIRWNLQNLAEDRKKINLKTAITSIKIFKDRLICGGFSSLLICDLNATLLKTLTITEDGGVTEISCFHVLENGEVWAGTRHDGKIHVFDISTGHVKHVISIPNCRGISSINVFDDKIWAGLKHGEIYIYSVKDYSIWKQLQGHEDAVKVLYNIRESNDVLHSYMISGAGSRDGRVCVWNATEETL